MGGAWPGAPWGRISDRAFSAPSPVDGTRSLNPFPPPRCGRENSLSSQAPKPGRQSPKLSPPQRVVSPSENWPQWRVGGARGRRWVRSAGALETAPRGDRPPPRSLSVQFWSMCCRSEHVSPFKRQRQLPLVSLEAPVPGSSRKKRRPWASLMSHSWFPGYSEDGGALRGEVIPEHEFATGPVCLDDENEFPPVSIRNP